MSSLARDTGLTREGLYKALAPDGNPEFSTIIRSSGLSACAFAARLHTVDFAAREERLGVPSDARG